MPSIKVIIAGVIVALLAAAGGFYAYLNSEGY